MSELDALPEEYREIIEKYYEEPYGEVPPPLAGRMATGAELAPDFNMFVEKMRINAMFSDVLDTKTCQLVILGMLAGLGTPGTYFHVKSARRYGCSWDEIFKVAEIALFVKGNAALVDIGAAIARVHREEREAG